jgi:phosphate transport system substrate-binding protein
LSRIARSRLLSVMSVLALSFIVAACGGSAGGDQGSVSGSINIEGSSTVQPITQAAAELFRSEYPEARIEVGGAGTSDGFEAFCQGDTQISDASRPIDVAEEVPICEENGVEFIEIPVAFDATKIVDKQNGDELGTVRTINEHKKQ